MTLAEPSARQTDRGDGATITLSGDWIAPNAPAMSALAEVPKGTPQRVTIDAAGIGRIDTYGAWSINAMATAAGARGAPADIVGLADEPATVLRQVAEASRQTLPAPPRAGIVDFFETFGRVLFEIGGDSLSMLALFGSIVMSLVGVIARPRTLRWRSVVHNLDQMGVRAVPIVALMTFLVGCIIAQQGFFNFRKFGATDYVVDMVTILVLREIGVLLVTIMVAGRSGSACTAEIGSMKMREEIDALRTMGLDPIDVLGCRGFWRSSSPCRSSPSSRFWRRFMAPGSSPPLTAR